MNIIEKLRLKGRRIGLPPDALEFEAADEIENLRRQLAEENAKALADRENELADARAEIKRLLTERDEGHLK